MPISYLIPAGMSLLGGLMGSEEKTVGKTNPTSSTTNSSHSSATQNKIDPRMEQAIYGAGGIMPNAAAWYAKNSSGLNDQMVQGMNNQWNQLGASAQGFNQMQNLGMGLMGGGTAGNPFTGGGGIAPQQLSYTPAQMVNSGNSPFAMPTPTVAPAMGGGSGGGGGGGGGGEGNYGNPIGDALNAINGLGGANADPRGTWIDDVEGGHWSSTMNGGGGYTGYRPDNTPYQSIVPTGSTAGYGGYGGYSTLPAYSYPNSGGNS